MPSDHTATLDRLHLLTTGSLLLIILGACPTCLLAGRPTVMFRQAHLGLHGTYRQLAEVAEVLGGDHWLRPAQVSHLLARSAGGMLAALECSTCNHDRSDTLWDGAGALHIVRVGGKSDPAHTEGKALRRTLLTSW